jgi:chemotaxis protein CheD
MEVIVVGIGDFKIGTNESLLESYSLGSCVGIALYDPFVKIGGLAHIMLPNSSIAEPEKVQRHPGKFADTAIALMLDQMMKMGASRFRIAAKIAGGACMFESAMPEQLMNMGAKNVESVKKVLAERNIVVLAEDTGQNYGRTVRFNTWSGKLAVKSAKCGEIVL